MKIWFLFENVNQTQLSDLSFAEMIEKLDELKKPELDNWFAWKEGFSDWKKVLELPEIKDELKAFKKSFPIIENKVQPPPFKVPQKPITISKTAGKDLRKHERFDLKLRVIMRSDQITFRTFTKNLSAGGVAVEHEVPGNLINKECQMYISDPDSNSNIKFKATVVPNRNEAKFFLFTDLTEADQSKFEMWLKTFIKKLAQSA